MNLDLNIKIRRKIGVPRKAERLIYILRILNEPALINSILTGSLEYKFPLNYETKQEFQSFSTLPSKLSEKGAFELRSNDGWMMMKSVGK